MEQIIYFLFWAALFYFMMRFCCGPMMGRGAGGHKHGEGPSKKIGLGPYDPVCGMDLSDRTPVTFQFEDKTYYFCSTVCKNVFEKEPHKYMTGVGGKKEETATCC